MSRKNATALVHDLPAEAIANLDGDTNHVRVQVLTNAGAVDRDKQLTGRRTDHRHRRGRSR